MKKYIFFFFLIKDRQDLIFSRQTEKETHKTLVEEQGDIKTVSISTAPTGQSRLHSLR